MANPVRLGVYIDGYNLFNGALKGTGYKWLDVSAMAVRQLPIASCHISRLVYCSARIIHRPHDPTQGIRQNIYFRALQTIPQLEIVLGKFLKVASKYPKRPQPNPPPARPELVNVTRVEEKGSDVNLASRMIRDGFQGHYDVAVLVSGDSDLVEPVRIVQEDLKLDVVVLRPGKNRKSTQLQMIATDLIPIEDKVLAASQFPTTLTDRNGTFHRPPGW